MFRTKTGEYLRRSLPALFKLMLMCVYDVDAEVYITFPMTVPDVSVHINTMVFYNLFLQILYTIFVLRLNSLFCLVMKK